MIKTNNKACVINISSNLPARCCQSGCLLANSTKSQNVACRGIGCGGGKALGFPEVWPWRLRNKKRGGHCDLMSDTMERKARRSKLMRDWRLPVASLTPCHCCRATLSDDLKKIMSTTTKGRCVSFYYMYINANWRASRTAAFGCSTKSVHNWCHLRERARAPAMAAA
jgi:hypothetical protein